ncbi:MAG TPA: hypothetical protein DCF68_21265 [Cyanothece sp. UBA12306]|nr:hypothetical protein [Cyanothece sp. UBA12306]
MSLSSPRIFRISFLIRLTLVSFYISLTVPLPFLAKFTSAPIPSFVLWIGIILGLIVLVGVLSEQVILDNEKIQVIYPIWFRLFFRKGWSLSWSEIKDLKLRTTGQGGLVYYFVCHNSEQAYLLPMRVAGFSSLVNIVTEKTGIDTTDIRPLSQPWMYLILLILTLFLLLFDGWTIAQSSNL